MKKILVIGGSGFVGRALIPALLDAGHDVSVLNRGTHPVAGVTQLVADRDDQQSMARCAGAFDLVIDTSGYTAAQVETAFSVFGATTKTWIHLSSASVYRETPGRLPVETDTTGGAAIWGQYGADKSAADDVLLRQSQCPAVILRPPYLYGPHNNVDRETFVWARALSGRPVIVPGDGMARMQFLHVQDLARIFVHFVSAQAQRTTVYNIAEPETLTAENWVRRVAAVAGVEPDLLSGADLVPDAPARSYFPFRDVDCALDVSRFVADHNWSFRYRFEAGMSQTFATYDTGALRAKSPGSEVEQQIVSAGV